MKRIKNRSRKEIEISDDIYTKYNKEYIMTMYIRV